MDKKVLATATVTATIVGVTATTTAHADEVTSTPAVETVTETTTTQATTVEQAQNNVDTAQQAVTTASNAASAAEQAATTAQQQATQAEQAQKQNQDTINQTEQTLETEKATQEKAESELKVAQPALEQAKAEQEKAETENPTATQDLAKAQQENEQAKAEQAKAQEEVKTAQSDLQAKQDEATKAQNVEKSAEKAVETAQQDLTNALNDQQQAQDKVEGLDTQLTSKTSEVANKTAELEQAIKDAGDDTITYKQPKDVVTSEYEQTIQRGREQWGYNREDVQFTGEQTKRIELTPEQYQEYLEKGTITFKPNSKKVARLAFKLIKQLRELNGLKSDNIEFDEGKIQEFAEKRAKENFDRDMVTHDTKLTDIPKNKKWENANGTDMNNRVNDRKDALILSDEQMAYTIVYRYFNEYGSISYGHRKALLFGQGKFGMGLVTSEPDSLGYYYSHDTMQFYMDKVEHSDQEALWSVSEDGSTPYLNGQRIKFLPKTTFEYFVNETITEPNQAKIQAKQALESYTTQATSQINSLKSQLADAQNGLNVTTVNVESRKVAVATAQNSLQTAKADTNAKATTVTTAQSTLAQKQDVLNQATQTVNATALKLANAQSVAKDIVNAQNKTAQLQKQVDDLNATLNATQAKIQTLMETLTTAKAQEDGLKKAVLETSQALKQAVELKHQTARDLAQKQAELVVAQDVLAQLKAKEVKTAKGDQTQNGAANQEPELPIGVVPVDEKKDEVKDDDIKKDEVKDDEIKKDDDIKKDEKPSNEMKGEKKQERTPGQGQGYLSPAATQPMATMPVPIHRATPAQTGQNQLPATGSQDHIAYAMAGLALAGLGLVVKKKEGE